MTPVNTVTMASFDLIAQAKPQSHTEVLDIGDAYRNMIREELVRSENVVKCLV